MTLAASANIARFLTEKLCCFYILQLFPCKDFSLPCEAVVGAVCPYLHAGPKADVGLLNFLPS